MLPWRELYRTLVQTPRWQLHVPCIWWAWFTVGPPTAVPVTFATLLLPLSNFPMPSSSSRENVPWHSSQVPDQAQSFVVFEKRLFGISDSLFKSTFDVSVHFVMLFATAASQASLLIYMCTSTYG